MKTKKIAIAVLTVTLLAAALLVTSCIEPLDLKSNTEDDFKLPPGEGLVRIKISGGSGARTVFPDQDIANMYFRIEFTGWDALTGGSATTDASWPPAADTASKPGGGIAPIISEGWYDVKITAYNGPDTTTAVVIYEWDSTVSATQSPGDTGARIHVQNVSAVTVIATLTAQMTGADGLFKYSVTAPSLPSAGNSGDVLGAVEWATPPGKLSLYYFTGGGKGSSVSAFGTSGVRNLNNSTTADSTGTLLPSGYYFVEVEYDGGSYCQKRVMTDVVHIYDGLTTTYEPSIPQIIQNKFRVKFDSNSISVTNFSTLFPDVTVDSADRVREPNSGTAPVDSTAAKVFVGWSTKDDDDPSDLDEEWKFSVVNSGVNYSDHRVYTDDITLYAIWDDSGTSGTVNVTIRWDDVVGDPLVNISKAVKDSGNAPVLGAFIPGDILDNGYTITLTLNGVTVGGRWYYNGSEITAETDSGDGFELVINGTNAGSGGALYGILSVGGNEITVTGDDDGGNAFSATVTITVSSSK